jgi:hypothetical protein
LHEAAAKASPGKILPAYLSRKGDYSHHTRSSRQGFSKVVKIADVAAVSNRALSSAVRTRLGNRGYIRDFGKVLL